ncbi:anhydro-N-acetylmuramic acid kinase [Aidingimonas halophila]|uniref:Anhydro-N-acetylmuramic acid kinase n=1 Tax=Aidingimonas halophila TaxID=574349 RepID=A0A1H2YEP1_9GAMM|nr:anhydro-N-acetylmuramic acid kinase [Aidingimonas halophila]SDX03530.1 anhydro-N-acetylmuramic acid kinase [Aidingimonas halophila]
MKLFVGLMSGTSLDGVDAALIRHEPGRLPVLQASHAVPMPSDLRKCLLDLCQAETISFAALARAEHDFCHLQARAVDALLSKARISRDCITAIGSHGQTIEHAPSGHGDKPGPAYTCQLDNPSLLAELTGCQVVADFRRRDLAAGGQAAPLAPAFHAALFRHPRAWRLILNLGGFANLTLLPPESSDAAIIGFDTGPANVLLDAWYQRHHHGSYYDAQGQWASRGNVSQALLSRLLEDEFFHRHPPKSTGREAFHLPWLEARLRGENAADVQASLAELSAVTIAMGVAMACQYQSVSKVESLIVCGGGAHNTDLLERLARHIPEIAINKPDAFGWPADWLEAGAFAWLAARRLESLPGNLPSVTAATGPRILGGIYSA